MTWYLHTSLLLQNMIEFSSTPSYWYFFMMFFWYFSKLSFPDVTVPSTNRFTIFNFSVGVFFDWMLPITILDCTSLRLGKPTPKKFHNSRSSHFCSKFGLLWRIQLTFVYLGQGCVNVLYKQSLLFHFHVKIPSNHSTNNHGRDVFVCTLAV